MGGVFSSTTTNPSDTPSNLENPGMSDSDSKTQDPKSESPVSDTLEKPASDPSEGEKSREDLEQSEEVSEDGEEGEEEGECGFCLFMKGGGCKESFIAWEKCVEEAEKNKEDLVEKCSEVTGALKKCMEAHAEYYEPILRAEKMAEEEAVKELEAEKAKEKEKEKEASSQGSNQNAGSDSKVSEQRAASN